MTSQIIAGLMFIALTVGMVSGYKLRDYSADKEEAKSVAAELAKVKENLGILAITNAATVSKQQELLEKQTATNKAIEGVKREIKTKPVGGCSLTPDADSLRQQAYQATVGSLSK